MRLFQYRLQALLEKARHREEAHQMELVRRERALQEATARMERISTAIGEVAERLRRASAGVEGAVDVIRAGELQREVERLRGLMEQARALRRQMDRQVSEERERLIAAARRRRMLETHREALALTHHRAELASEAKQLDELATIRYNRQARDASRTP